MGAPKGNKFNEIWTIEKTNEMIGSIYDHIILDDDCCSLEEACVANGIYSEIISYLRDKHNKGKDFKLIKEAREVLKSRLIKKGLDNTHNTAMSIFVLKVQHRMKEEQHVHHSINITPKKWVG